MWSIHRAHPVALEHSVLIQTKIHLEASGWTFPTEGMTQNCRHQQHRINLCWLQYMQWCCSRRNQSLCLDELKCVFLVLAITKPTQGFSLRAASCFLSSPVPSAWSWSYFLWSMEGFASLELCALNQPATLSENSVLLHQHRIEDGLVKYGWSLAWCP